MLLFAESHVEQGFAAFIIRFSNDKWTVCCRPSPKNGLPQMAFLRVFAFMQKTEVFGAQDKTGKPSAQNQKGRLPIESSFWFFASHGPRAFHLVSATPWKRTGTPAYQP